jgi:hypothetical protein
MLSSTHHRSRGETVSESRPQLRSNRGVVDFVLVFGIMFLLFIYGISGWFVGSSLSREVRMAEAGHATRLALESSLEEALQGFLLTVNIGEDTDLPGSERQRAKEFAKAIRLLEPGEVLTARFVPHNTRTAVATLDIELDSIQLTAFNESAMDGDQPLEKDARKKACKNLKKVMEKWSAIPG